MGVGVLWPSENWLGVAIGLGVLWGVMLLLVVLLRKRIMLSIAFVKDPICNS